MKLKQDGTPNKTTVGELKYKFDAGDVVTNNAGNRYKVIKRTHNRVWVEFLDHRNYCLAFPVSSTSAVSGKTKDWYAPSVYGVGICGFPPEKDSPVYYAWKCLLHRTLYKPEARYKDSTVSDEFMCYEEFYWWYRREEKVKGYPYQIDKDLFSVTGDPHYSSGTCCLIPKEVNMALSKRKEPKTIIKSIHGYDLGILDRKNNKSKLPMDEYFQTPEDAIKFYNFYRKENLNRVVRKNSSVMKDYVISRLEDYNFDYEFVVK